MLLGRAHNMMWRGHCGDNKAMYWNYPPKMPSKQTFRVGDYQTQSSLGANPRQEFCILRGACQSGCHKGKPLWVKRDLIGHQLPVRWLPRLDTNHFCSQMTNWPCCRGSTHYTCLKRTHVLKVKLTPKSFDLNLWEECWPSPCISLMRVQCACNISN